jgi:hypothetical protein
MVDVNYPSAQRACGVAHDRCQYDLGFPSLDGSHILETAEKADAVSGEAYLAEVGFVNWQKYQLTGEFFLATLTVIGPSNNGKASVTSDSIVTSYFSRAELVSGV